ncbi:phospholipase A1 [Papilio machaon]|uniref:phospholipase A1 n=1 Tax=Papilio machaon TaxID=76193 RepID=UPI001E66369A|nr:phospholipase A1 [Papilio machaon]
MNACVLFWFLSVLFVFASCDEEDIDIKINQEAKLRFYYGSMENYTELYIYEAHKIFSETWYDSSKSTVIFSHGFTGRPTGPAVTAVITAYIDEGKSNVVLLNWQDLASMALPGFASSYMKWAAPNARKLGVRFANTLSNMAAAGLNLKKIHLIGHSLGAHLFGITGTTLASRGMQPSCITGLDPSRVGFDNKPYHLRLNPESAESVVVVHTDSSKYGAKGSMGKVDFWPNFRNNGHVIQPGCDERPAQTFSMADLCNHNRCWELLIDSMKHPGTLLGSHAKNYRVWKNYSAEEKKAVTMTIGKCDPNAVPGNYYLTTNAETPFGRGEEGL